MLYDNAKLFKWTLGIHLSTSEQRIAVVQQHLLCVVHSIILTAVIYLPIYKFDWALNLDKPNILTKQDIRQSKLKQQKETIFSQHFSRKLDNVNKKELRSLTQRFSDQCKYTCWLWNNEAWYYVLLVLIIRCLSIFVGEKKYGNIETHQGT